MARTGQILFAIVYFSIISIVLPHDITASSRHWWRYWAAFCYLLGVVPVDSSSKMH